MKELKIGKRYISKKGIVLLTIYFTLLATLLICAFTWQKLWLIIFLSVTITSIVFRPILQKEIR